MLIGRPALLAPTDQEKRQNYIQAASSLSANIADNEKMSKDSSYNAYRFAASSYYNVALHSSDKSEQLENFTQARALYYEAKKRLPFQDDSVDKRLQAIDASIAALQ